MPLPDLFLQELKARTDMAELVASYVNLRRSGRNLVGLCPFHHEKTPSFNVYPENGSFYCFGCGVGGDVITFVRKIENLDYMEAVRFLANRAGMQVPEEQVDDTMAKLRARVLEINRETARFFHRVLLSPEGRPGLDYLTRRGLSMKTIRHFGLGFSPPGRFSLTDHLKKMGYTDQELIQANVAFQSRSGRTMDRFASRVMFPIIDLRGNVVAFGGRILTDEKPKYINTSDTPVYHKSSGLFAMNFAKNNGGEQLILAEGYMDVISLHQAGFTNAMASLGTSLTMEQARLMARYAKEVVICYDSDAAGQKAASRAIPMLRDAGLLVKVLTVPGNKDPDEYIKAYGIDAFRALMQNAENGYAFRLTQSLKRFPGDNMDQKLSVLGDVLPYLAKIRHPAELDVAVRHTADRLFLSEQAIKNELAAYRRGAGRRNRYRQPEETEAPVVQAAPKLDFPKNEVVLLCGMLADPAFAERIEACGGAKLFQSVLRTIYEDFQAQAAQNGQIDSSRLDVGVSSVFAAATMQHPDAFPEELDSAQRQALLERTLLAQQNQLIDQRYRTLLNKIGSLEKGGKPDEMEQALIELETIRQKKTQFEDRMRGDKG